MNKKRDKQKQIDIHTNREKYKTDRITNTKKTGRNTNRQPVNQQSDTQPS